MRRFRFRLERLEKWRRQSAEGKKREHEAATLRALLAEQALAAHDMTAEAFLAEEARRRRDEALEVGALIAAETVRRALDGQRSGLDARYADSLRVVETSLEQLVEARRDLKAIEGLDRARRMAWRRQLESELQKQADEIHRARLLLAAGGEAEADSAGTPRGSEASPNEGRP